MIEKVPRFMIERARKWKFCQNLSLTKSAFATLFPEEIPHAKNARPLRLVKQLRPLWWHSRPLTLRLSAIARLDMPGLRAATQIWSTSLPRLRGRACRRTALGLGLGV